jgi:LysR family transcriptional regulator of abg operon
MKLENRVAVTQGNYMKLQHVEVIVAIADAGSLRGAAIILGKSQPTLTAILRQVEDDLSGAVFQRSSRGVIATRLGERMLNRCRSLSSEITRLNDEVAQLRGEKTGELHVCVSPIAAITIIPQALKAFRKTHLGVRVHIFQAGCFQTL